MLVLRKHDPRNRFPHPADVPAIWNFPPMASPRVVPISSGYSAVIAGCCSSASDSHDLPVSAKLSLGNSWSVGERQSRLEIYWKRTRGRKESRAN